jgi:cation:H+ antiporter
LQNTPSLTDNDKKSMFGGMMSALLGIGLFVIGVLLAVWATERLLEGLVGLSVAFRLSAFAVGTVFGGAIFLVCVALGVGAVLFPLEIRLPRGVLAVFAASPLLVGLSLIAPITPRWTGAVLLIAFVAAMIYLVNVSRHQNFLVSGEVREEQEKHHPLWVALGLTLMGIVIIGIGGELVAQGAEGIIAALGVPALFMGMIVSPAAIELEEVIRQAVPSKEGRPDVSAGNLVGTLLYFLLFNLGLIALLTPVRVDPLVRELDWPFLVVVTLIAAAFLWRGRVGRSAGVLLLLAYVIYIVLHIVLR